MTRFDRRRSPYDSYPIIKNKDDLELLPEKYKNLDFNINNSLVTIKGHSYLGGKDFSPEELDMKIFHSSLDKIHLNGFYETIQVIKIDKQLFINPWFKQPDFFILGKVILETKIPIEYEIIINNLNKLLTPLPDYEWIVGSNPIIITADGVFDHIFRPDRLKSIDSYISQLKESSIGIYLENN